MALKTENGWYQVDSTQLDTSPIPGTDIIIPLQKGYPSKILKAFAADFHANVESLYNARGATDEGGWTPTNSVATSNHLSATAMDLNWSDHPMGKAYDGYTPDEINALRELLSYYTFGGVQLVWWGNDWNSPKDSMHFQMGYGTYGANSLMDQFIAERIGPDGLSLYKRDAPITIERKPVVPGPAGTTWADVSQYQKTPIGYDYPYPVFSFRTNSGDVEDTLARENARRAKDLLDNGGLDLVIPYYYFRPGQANCDLHKEILSETGLFDHPRTVTMVDAESQATDCSWEINDEVNRLRGWYGSFYRVIGYYNSNANPMMWQTRGGINLVVPQYNRTQGDISSIKNAQVRKDAFAHQYTDAGSVASWSKVDLNWSPYSVNELLQLFGIEKASETVTLTNDQMLKNIYDKIMAYPDAPALGGKWPSRALFADTSGGIDDTVGMLLNTDGHAWDILVILSALVGSTEDMARIKRVADSGNKRAKEILSFISTFYEEIEVKK